MLEAQRRRPTRRIEEEDGLLKRTLAATGTVAGAALRPVGRYVVTHPLDAMAVLALAAAATLILSNALLRQTARHPAPLFAERGAEPPAAPIAQRPRTDTTGTVAPAALRKPADAPAGRPKAEIVAEVQRELLRRGFYDGAVDGLTGPKTDAAIRDYEQAMGLKQTGEATEALVAQLKRSQIAKPSPDKPVAEKPPADKPAQRTVTAIQRALVKQGYGPLKTDGLFGTDTRAAIEKFERDRNLPVTGEASPRVVRELASLSGIPIE